MRDAKETDPARIRRARPEDADALAELAAGLFRQTYEGEVPATDLAAFLTSGFGPAAQRAELDDPETSTLLVEYGGRAVGYAQIRLRRLSLGGSTVQADLELMRIYLDSGWHGKGLAQALLQEVVRAARELGGVSLWLGVWERNDRAIAFYEKSGFRRVGAKEFHLGGQLHRDLVMVAELASL
jgi:ribosomal protein S18 acetylase RimI-like enzyme